MEKNPFIQDGAMLPLASLNRLMLRRQDEIKPVQVWLSEMNQLDKAEMNAEIFFDLIFALKRKPENLTHELWNASHYEYWRGIEKIELCGGIMESLAAKQWVKIVQDKIEKSGLALELAVQSYPSQASVIGGAKRLSLFQKQGLVFDFGHTHIKRGRITRQKEAFLIELRSACLAKYTEWNQNVCEAEKLHAFIVSLLEKELRDSGEENLLLSFANYISSKGLAARGGYGKLALLDGQYGQLLCDQLTQRLNRKITLTCYHDTTCAAFGAKPGGRTAVISLGTSLGISFAPMELIKAIDQNEFQIKEAYN